MSSDEYLPRYLQALIDYVRKETRTIVGLHSGTSADGPTALIAKFSGSGRDTRFEIIDWQDYDYESPLQERIFDVFYRNTGSVDRIAQADNALGAYFAEVAERIVDRAGLALRDVDLIVSSGQVCYQVIDGQREDHNWLGDTAVTAFLDMGAGAFIAERTGVTTVSNLRQRDIAAGGLGVPTVSYGDWALFTHDERSRALHNIGGIANPTVLPAGGTLDDMFAFDSGPGNMIMDAFVGWISDGRQAFDEDGRLAAAGTANRQLLTEFMDHPFIRQRPPKAAARQLFGHEYARGFFDRGREIGLSDADLLATAAAFTADSIAFAYREHILPRIAIDEIFLAGGGASNTTLVDLIRERLAPIPVRTLDDLGVPVQAREVLTMMAIGNQTIQGEAGNVPAATGAGRHVIAGDITPGGRPSSR